MLLLVSLALVAFTHADSDGGWCGASVNKCSTVRDGLTNLACGFCRSWTSASSIANGVLRVKGLDGGALPGDSSNNNNMAYVSLDKVFDTENGSVWSLQTLPTSVPDTKSGAFWTSKDNVTIYAYGGSGPNTGLAPPDTSSLPQHDVQSQVWSVPSGGTVQTIRLDGGADVNIPAAQVAYYLGGYTSDLTSQTVTDDKQHYAASMLEFNTTTAAVREIAADTILPGQYGALTYLPYGSEGILLYFGGEKPSSSVVTNCTGCAINAWDHVWIFDLQSESWHRQATINSATPRSDFCTSTVYDTQSNTWQIWTMGGVELTSQTVLTDVVVLSIPSFKWFPANAGNKRMSVSCQTVGSQVFVIGGRTENSGVGGDNYDSLAYIYDMNKQAVVSSFDPASTSYAAPSSIQAASTSTPTSWGDATISSLFAAAATITMSVQSGQTSVSGSSSSSTLSSNTGQTTASSVTNASGSGISAGAVAGIAVGAAAVIALIVATLFLVLRGRRRGQIAELHAHSSPMAVHTAEKHHAEMPAMHERTELDAGAAKYEMPTVQPLHELD